MASEHFDGRPFSGITDEEWTEARDSEKARMIAKELRRVADLLDPIGFKPRTPWSPKEWERIELFLNRT